MKYTRVSSNLDPVVSRISPWQYSTIVLAIVAVGSIVVVVLFATSVIKAEKDAVAANPPPPAGPTIAPSGQTTAPPGPAPVPPGPGPIPTSTVPATVTTQIPGLDNDWTVSHLTEIADANVFAIFWGGGSSTSLVNISTNKPVNPFLVQSVVNYTGTPARSTSRVDGFPTDIAMGSITEVASIVTDQLKLLPTLSSLFRYEGDGAGNVGCYFDNLDAVVINFITENDKANGKSVLLDALTYLVIPSLMLDNITKIWYAGTLTTSNTVVTITYSQCTLCTNVYTNLTIAATATTITFQIVIPVGVIPWIPVSITLSPDDSICYTGSYWGGKYVPQLDAMVDQSIAVGLAINKSIVTAVVYYTHQYSNSVESIIASTVNPYLVKTQLYNLIYEAIIAQRRFDTNSARVTLQLNPDTTMIFQTCSSTGCPQKWRDNLSVETPMLPIMANAGFRASFQIALARLVKRGEITIDRSNAVLQKYDDAGILILPANCGRTVPGLPELVLTHSFIIRTFAPNVTFGYGMNIYDSQNWRLPSVINGQPAPFDSIAPPAFPWQTSSFNWIHLVQRLPVNVSAQDVQTHIMIQANKVRYIYIYIYI